MDTNDLRKRAMAVYLATESGPAEDISKHLKWAADEIDRLREHLLRMDRQVSAGLAVHGMALMVDPENNYSIASRT